MRILHPNFHSHEHGSVAAPRASLLAPARILLPLFRWPLGYEILMPHRAIVRLLVAAALPPAVMLGMGLISDVPLPAEGYAYLAVLIAASFAVTCLRFLSRAWGVHRGREVHSADAGYSIVARLLPLPAFLIEQLIVPALLGWGGFEIGVSVSVDLGVFLMMAAASYLLLANWEWRQRLAQGRAPVDDKLRAQHFAQTVDDHERKASRPKRKAKTGAVFPTTLAPDIAEIGRGRK